MEHTKNHKAAKLSIEAEIFEIPKPDERLKFTKKFKDRMESSRATTQKEATKIVILMLLEKHLYLDNEPLFNQIHIVMTALRNEGYFGIGAAS